MILENKEIDELKKASDEHRTRCKASLCVEYASGGGIGTRVLATCASCGKEYDVTDYDCW